MNKVRKQSNTRGFRKMIGKTIAKVDTTAINMVHVLFTDGTKLTIDSEPSHYGFPVLNVTKDQSIYVTSKKGR